MFPVSDLCIYQFICLSVDLPIYLASVFKSIFLSIRLDTYLSIDLSLLAQDQHTCSKCVCSQVVSALLDSLIV